MKPSLRNRILSLALVGGLLPLVAFSQPAKPASPTTAVLAISKTGTNPDRSKFNDIFPSEVKATVGLFLEGKISAWYSKKDQPGVVFIMNCASVEEARTALATLPLYQEKLLDFDLTPIGPLDPLRVLLNRAPEKK